MCPLFGSIVGDPPDCPNVKLSGEHLITAYSKVVILYIITIKINSGR